MSNSESMRVTESDVGISAGELAQRCLDGMVAQDDAAIASMFHAEAIWELAYAMTGQSDADRMLHGRQIARFHSNMFRIIRTSRFSDVRIEAVSADIAYVTCRSHAELISDDRYGNYYMVRVTAREGLIVHWLEFYDPRPAERVRTVLTDLLTGRTA